MSSKKDLHKSKQLAVREESNVSLPGLFKDKYNPKRKLGHGNFGTAWLVEDEDDAQREKVVKQIFVGLLGPDETSEALQEAKLLAALDHPNIVGFYEAFTHADQFVCIVTEYCDGGDLGTYIEQTRCDGDRIPQEKIMSWTIQLLLALDYMHTRKVLHRDLKSKNVFLKRGMIKLGDFGIARILGSSSFIKTMAGTPYYMSPETMQNNGYNGKSDMWALGCILVELCLLELAFSGDSLLALTYKICEGKLPELPKFYSPELRDLVMQLLNRDQYARPGPRTVLSMPFVQLHRDQLDKTLSASQVALERRRVAEAASPSHKKRRRRTRTHGSSSDSHRREQLSGGNTTNTKRKDLTPKQRAEIRRRAKADRRAAELSSVAQKSALETGVARARNRAHATGETWDGTKEKSNDKFMSTDDSGGDSFTPGVPHWLQAHPDIFPDGAPPTVVVGSDVSSGESDAADPNFKEETTFTSMTSGLSFEDELETTLLLRDAIKSAAQRASTSPAGKANVKAESRKKSPGTSNSGEEGAPPCDPPLALHDTLDGSAHEINNRRVRQRCIETLGEATFRKVHKFLLRSLQKESDADRGTPKSYERRLKTLRKIVGSDETLIRECNRVEQLVLAELIASSQSSQKQRESSNKTQSRSCIIL